MKMLRLSIAPTIACLAFISSITLHAQLPAPPDAKDVLSDSYTGKSYSPYAKRSFPSNVYWGDTHLHTGLSLDAGLFGNTLKPSDAWRFAKGEEVVSSIGLPVKLLGLGHVAAVFLFGAHHECVHKSPFRSEWIGRVLNWPLGLLLFYPPRYLWHFHMYHHQHTQDPARDPSRGIRERPDHGRNAAGLDAAGAR